MERAEQDAEGRFRGGIFSGREVRQEPGYGLKAETAGNTSGVAPDIPAQSPGQTYYKHPLLAQLEQKQKVGRHGTGVPAAGVYSGGNLPSGRGVPDGRPAGNGTVGTGAAGSYPAGGYPAGHRPAGGYSPGTGTMGSRPAGNYPVGNGGRGNLGGGACRGFMEGRCPCGCGDCRKRKQPNHTAYLLVLFAVFGMLFAAFLLVMFLLVSVVSRQSAVLDRAAAQFSGDEWSYAVPDKQEPAAPLPGGQAKIPEKDTAAHGEYYGEIKDAVRTDLSYSIEWENYEYAGNSDTVMISIDYPVIMGDVPNLGLLNDAIESEMEYFEEYFEEYSKYMQPEEIFAVYSEGFVTYMDESVMSVVFQENIYTDYWVDCGLFCVNIDMENGMILDNGSILEVDDEFAVDFRTRSREQNGETEVLEYLTDQEVAYYLKDGSTGIIFYTPMGMEIGLNCGEEYLTVTYQDYEDYLLKY